MKLLTERAEFLVECLDLPEAAQVDDAVWERFQIAHLNDDSPFRIEDKSRQIAWSFTVAAEAVANAVLDRESTVFVSINLDEAKEKTRYARRVYENLQIGGLPGMSRDHILGMEFTNGARIMSLPSRPPRGKAKMNVVLDEFAHVQHDRLIYAAALPIITRGGRMRVGSSPMGAGGVFWEISQQELQAYPGYTRARTPWWQVAAFCRRSPALARGVGMSTAERVEQFGGVRIQAIHANMLLDDFQQEYECAYIDETISFFTWTIIRRNQDATLQCWHVKDPDAIGRAVDEMRAVVGKKIETVFVGGVDIGRKKHLTEIMVCGISLAGTPVRLMVSLDRQEFAVQEMVLRHILGALPVAVCLIDQNGLGMHLAENLAVDTVAVGVNFTNASKALWATELRIQLEKSGVPLPPDRSLAYQIHSVKKKITAAKNNVYDTEANEKHHADKMWALALAVWGARECRDRPTWGPGIQRGR